MDTVNTPAGSTFYNNPYYIVSFSLIQMKKSRVKHRYEDSNKELFTGIRRLTVDVAPVSISDYNPTFSLSGNHILLPWHHVRAAQNHRIGDGRRVIHSPSYKM